jgi:hypothetical protein
MISKHSDSLQGGGGEIRYVFVSEGTYGESRHFGQTEKMAVFTHTI